MVPARDSAVLSMCLLPAMEKSVLPPQADVVGGPVNVFRHCQVINIYHVSVLIHVKTNPYL